MVSYEVVFRHPWRPSRPWIRDRIPAQIRGNRRTGSNTTRQQLPRRRHITSSAHHIIRMFDSIYHCAACSLVTLYEQNSAVVLEESPCPRGFLRTKLQVLVLFLGPQVLVLVFGRCGVSALQCKRWCSTPEWFRGEFLMRRYINICLFVLGSQILVLVLRPQVLVLEPYVFDNNTGTKAKPDSLGCTRCNRCNCK